MVNKAELRHVPEVPRPVDLIAGSLTLAAVDESYYAQYGSRGKFNELLLRGLHLDTPEPDGRQLMERLVMGEGLVRGVSNLRKVTGCLKGSSELAYQGMERRTNPMQEELGEDLSTMAARQFTREGSICPGVTSLLLAAPERYISDFPDLKAKVFTGEVFQTAGAYGGTVEDAQAVAGAWLYVTGLRTRQAIVPSVGVFLPQEGKLLSLHEIPQQQMGEKARAEALLFGIDALHDTLVQGPVDLQPHQFVLRRRTRRR